MCVFSAVLLHTTHIDYWYSFRILSDRSIENIYLIENWRKTLRDEYHVGGFSYIVVTKPNYAVFTASHNFLIQSNNSVENSKNYVSIILVERYRYIVCNTYSSLYPKIRQKTFLFLNPFNVYKYRPRYIQYSCQLDI